MLRRLKLFWKLSLIAALIPLSVGVGMAVSLNGARQLKAEYDNLYGFYGFTRIPLMALDEADTRREALEGDLRELTRPDLSPERRTLLVQRIHENDRAMATLAQHRKEWLRTLNTDFTAGLESNTRAQAVLDRMVSQLQQVGLLLSLAGIVAAWGLSRLIVRPLESLIRLTSGVSRGEIETLKGEAWEQPDPRARDEVGTLLRTTWDMVGSTQQLTEMMSEVRAGTHTLVETSSRVSTLAHAVDRGAHEQQAHLYDISPGIIDMLYYSLTETAEQCRQLEQMALQGEQDAERGSQEVFQAVAAMKDLASRVSLLEELASQTSLLAQSATTESARTGEHGGDFARVAHEVRKLGERSQTAARHIGELAASNMKLAERSEQSLRELVPSIRETTVLVQQMARASLHHDMAMTQLKRSEICHLVGTADHMCNDSEQLAAEAERLVSCAQRMQHLTARFHLKQAKEAGG